MTTSTVSNNVTAVKRTREQHLSDLAAAARKVEEHHQLLVREMVEARHAGIPLRAIAEAAGRSHEQVRRLVEDA